MKETLMKVPCGREFLEGTLSIPDRPVGLVVFVHGSGSSRFSPRNRFVAEMLQQADLATLLTDLLTPAEEEVDRYSARLRFDIDLLVERVELITDALRHLDPLPLGYFGSSTGAAAALRAAVRRSTRVRAVVSRGGRPDLVPDDILARVEAPVLLIVGGLDEQVLELNRDAQSHLRVENRLAIVPGATHLFEETGALEQVADLAAAWFSSHLAGVGVEQEAARRDR
jgi:pimeloyl-ACP methyl ester carboxylesterase